VCGPVSHFYRDFFNRFLRFNFLNGLSFPKPDYGLLELAESADLPAMKAAQEREEAGAMMRIGRIEHSQPLLFSESDFVESADEPGNILDGEDWLGAYMKCAHIQQSPIHTAFSASPGNFG
jgi:hypothetical protein